MVLSIDINDILFFDFSANERLKEYVAYICRVLHEIENRANFWRRVARTVAFLPCSNFFRYFTIGERSSEDGTRSLGYELGWRHLSDPSLCASPSIVAHLGESIKSAATCTFVSDGMVTSLEVGGLADYCKASIGGGLAIELSGSSELVLEGSTGAIIGSAGPPDRFHLGGIVPWGSMRGYQSCGIGPTDKRRKRGGSSPLKGLRPRDALGGNFLFSLFGALRFDVPSPLMRALGMRGQIFLQAGANEARFQDVAMRVSWRTSGGVGVVVPTALGTLEVNACAALAHKDTDFKTGFQFGLTPGL